MNLAQAQMLCPESIREDYGLRGINFVVAKGYMIVPGYLKLVEHEAESDFICLADTG
jgi:hypothetical protein